MAQEIRCKLYSVPESRSDYADLVGEAGTLTVHSRDAKFKADNGETLVIERRGDWYNHNVIKIPTRKREVFFFTRINPIPDGACDGDF